MTFFYTNTQLFYTAFFFVSFSESSESEDDKIVDKN